MSGGFSGLPGLSAPFYLRQPRSEGLYLALLRRYHLLQPRYLYDKEIGKNSPFSITATVSVTENPVTLTEISVSLTVAPVCVGLFLPRC